MCQFLYIFVQIKIYMSIEREKNLRIIGEEQIKNGKFGDAIETYNKLIMGKVIDINDLNMLGIAYSKNNELEKARFVFLEIIHLFPEHKLARNNFVEISNILIKISSINDNDKIEELENLLGYEPTNYNVIDTLINLCIKNNKKTKAIIYGKYAININPKNINARIQLGNIYLSTMQYENAMNEINEAIKIQPENKELQQYIDDIKKQKEEFYIKIQNGETFNIGIFMYLYKTMQEICDGLFIGSRSAASDLEELQKNNISCILNITEEVPNFFEKSEYNFVYHREKLTDSLTSNIIEGGLLDRCFEFIDNALINGKKVLVHCQAGISRSGAVIVAYLMKKYNIDYDTALKRAKEKRECICPNSSFEKQIKENINYETGILDVFERCLKGLEPIKPKYVRAFSL